MTRIIVIADTPDDAVLFDERVPTVLMESRFASEQLMERLAWAVADAEEAERAAQRCA